MGDHQEKHNKQAQSPLIRVSRDLVIFLAQGGDTLKNKGFPYKCKYLLQKANNFYLTFRTFSISALF